MFPSSRRRPTTSVVSEKVVTHYPDPHADRILILDFGSQYAQLIARNVREGGVYCEIHPCDMALEDIRAFAPRGIILSGGPESVLHGETPRAHAEIFDMELPVLGICYGMQTMAAQLGGEVETAEQREYGHAELNCSFESRLLGGLAARTDVAGEPLLDVWMSHGDRVSTMPPGFEAIAYTSNAPLAAIADEGRNFYGLQFHPEVTHTRRGKDILLRFIHEICGCGAEWTPGNIVDSIVDSVRDQVGDDEVILGLSGGVDSSVVAALLHRAI
ncbi:MAG: glutamine-hydrolyzing GMP synthase, partial [Pseudomonadota bacterium]|nr:glutamine-hydrolyzing GMP synthase [Pseudomonadota bacterium]